MPQLILAIDQGTTGTTTVLYNKNGLPEAVARRPLTQHYPQPGWVEHDPNEIWLTVRETIAEVMRNRRGCVAGIGITNQRETIVAWNRHTGRPVHNAIVWQCRRSADICRELMPYAGRIREKTGLPLDPYFSGSKLKWLFAHLHPTYHDDLLVGTVDTWLIWRLTGGRQHLTDVTNAARTLLFDIHRRRWDDDLLQLFEIAAGHLPTVKKSLDHFGTVDGLAELQGVPILAVAGDQQAALFGHAGFSAGSAKNTYGTGGFLVMNTGDRPIRANHGLLTTLAVDGSGSPCYALEGSIFIAGAAIQWLRDQLGLLERAADSEAAARAVPDNGGVYLVPAFTGLGTPHWDMDARGTIVGLTRGANRNHLIRAALESMAYQTRDVIDAMERETGSTIAELAVDGGAAENNFLLQFQADIAAKIVRRPPVLEATSRGAAFMAGLHAGLWRGSEVLAGLGQQDDRFRPALDDTRRDELLAGWRRALRQATTR